MQVLVRALAEEIASSKGEARAKADVLSRREQKIDAMRRSSRAIEEAVRASEARATGSALPVLQLLL